MESLLGLIMIYSFIHGIVIVNKKITGTTQYENMVLTIGAISLTLLVIGIMFKSVN